MTQTLAVQYEDVHVHDLIYPLFLGVDVNAYGEGTDPALLIAAQNAHENVLKILINHSKTDICVSGTYGTILHTILWQPMPHKSYERSLHQILSSEHTRRQLRFAMKFFFIFFLGTA